MNRSGSTFTPDVRNLGGRKMVVDMVSKHVASLDMIHSSLVLSSPSLHRQQKTAQQKRELSSKLLDEHSEKIREKLSHVKSVVSTKQPVSYNLIRRGDPSCATSKRLQFEMAEHHKRLSA